MLIATRLVKWFSEQLYCISEPFSVWLMKVIILLFSLIILAGCSTTNKNSKSNLDKILKENLNVEKDVKLVLPGSLRAIQKEKVAFINVHDFPDSALLSAKTKMNPPDLAIDEAKVLQMERSEILRQALETFCDKCEHFEVILPIGKLSEQQFNFFFDKIFLRQEVSWSELGELTAELTNYDKLVLILSSEDYEKNRGSNTSNQVIATTEAFIRSEIYIFDLKKKVAVERLNINLSSREHLYYAKAESTEKQEPKVLKEVTDDKIKTLLNDFRYDDVYPYPITSESLTLFNFFYNELCKSLFMDTE